MRLLIRAARYGGGWIAGLVVAALATVGPPAFCGRVGEALCGC